MKIELKKSELEIITRAMVISLNHPAMAEISKEDAHALMTLLRKLILIEENMGGDK